MIELLLQAERYMDMGLVDQADAIYRGLASSDPQNAVAVAGMARVEIERGDDREAYRLATRALSIDPENAVARRLEARLYEVLTTRGEHVERSAVARGGVLYAPSREPAAPASGPAAASSAAPPPAMAAARPAMPAEPGASASERDGSAAHRDASVAERDASAAPPQRREAGAAPHPVDARGGPASGRSWVRRMLRRR